MASKVSLSLGCLLFQMKLVINCVTLGNKLDGGCKGMNWNRYTNVGKTFLLTILTLAYYADGKI